MIITGKNCNRPVLRQVHLFYQDLDDGLVIKMHHLSADADDSSGSFFSGK